jgi:type IV fimbrial biogenesis protein FimT
MDNNKARHNAHHAIPAARAMRNAACGITLIELLMAIAVLGVLLGVAMPAFSGAAEATRATSARTALMGSFLAALNGATIANARTDLCPSSDGNTCLDSTDWSNGWIAFVDADGDRERQSGEQILSQQPALAGKVRLHSTAGRTRIEVQASGSVAGSNVTFTLCDGRGASHAKSLVLSNKNTLTAGMATPEAVAATCVP